MTVEAARGSSRAASGTRAPMNASASSSLSASAAAWPRCSIRASRIDAADGIDLPFALEFELELPFELALGEPSCDLRPTTPTRGRAREPRRGLRRWQPPRARADAAQPERRRGRRRRATCRRAGEDAGPARQGSDAAEELLALRSALDLPPTRARLRTPARLPARIVHNSSLMTVRLEPGSQFGRRARGRAAAGVVVRWGRCAVRVARTLR